MITILFLSFQRQVFSALSQISKHSVDLAEMVVEAEIFPAVLTCLKDPDEYVKKNVATLIREIAKHTPEVQCNNEYQTLLILFLSVLWMRMQKLSPCKFGILDTAQRL